METEGEPSRLTETPLPAPTPLRVDAITSQEVRLNADNKKHELVEMDHIREMQARDTATPKILAIFIVFGFFAVLFWLLAFGLKSDSIEVVLMLVGALIPAVGMVLSYHFGSSAGSSRKTEAILSKIKEGQ